MEVSGKTQDRSTKDSAGKSSDEDEQIYCQPCSSDGDYVTAIGYCQNCNEYLCAGCLKVHRKQAMSRNHNILDGDNMPKVTLPSVNLKACSDICPKHVNEIIKYYCFTHGVLGCGDCMIIDHNSCKASRIQDISTEYFNGTEHQDIMKKVHQFAKVMDNMKKDIQTSEKKMKEAYENAVKDVRKFKKEIIDSLDKAEGEMLEMITKRVQRDKSLVLKLKQEEKCLDDGIKEICTKLQLQQNHANKLFVEAKQVKGKLISIEKNIEQLKNDTNIDLYEFRRSSRIGQIIDVSLKLGELSVIIDETGNVVRHKAPNEECVTNIADQTVEVKNISEMDLYFDCEIDIKLQEDASVCCVDDCGLLSKNQLVVADSGNNCIRIVDVRNKNVSKYKLDGRPSGIAVVNPNLFAVALPKESKIQFFAIANGNKITERDIINVGKRCEKIAIYENKIIGITNDTVEIMSMNGQKIKSISNPKLAWLVDIAVEPNARMFYVSNISYHLGGGVYKFDFDGNLMATYEDKELVKVRGLEVTRDGTLLVCNWVEDGSIHMITSDCKKIKELLKQSEHVSYPWCVAFCNETNTLFLANFMASRDRKRKNVLKVFQLK